MKGLQGQRTSLAWGRTSLALFVNALLVVRSGLVQEQRVLVALGAGLFATAVVGMVFAAWRGRRLNDSESPTSSPPAALLFAAVATWSACAFQLIGIVMRAK